MAVFLIFILWIIAIVLTIKRIFERADVEQNTKLLWAILIVVAPMLGMIIYYLVGEKRLR
jgi:divalent metal cation (Fe/Co/Zn/Cd) transporter